MSGFMNTGSIEPFDSGVANMGANLALFGVTTHFADKVRMSAASDLFEAAGANRKLATKYLGQIKPRGFFGKVGGHLSSFIGGSPTERVLDTAYKYNARFNTGEVMAGPSRFFTGHKFRGTLATIGGRGAEEFGTKELAKKLMWKELGTAGLGFLNKLTGVQMLGGAATMGMVLAGFRDYDNIYLNRGKAEKERQMKSQSTLTMSPGFYDNRGAATMRQRGLAAIHNSQMNLQQVFGQESTFNHQ